MKMKKEYVEPEIEIIKFDDEDIILTSTGASGTTVGEGYDEFDWDDLNG